MEFNEFKEFRLSEYSLPVAVSSQRLTSRKCFPPMNLIHHPRDAGTDLSAALRQASFHGTLRFCQTSDSHLHKLLSFGRRSEIHLGRWMNSPWRCCHASSDEILPRNNERRAISYPRIKKESFLREARENVSDASWL